MKTKEFIAMLQKADPSGEGYIRMSGGVPKYAEAKEGYWDGAYQYIDIEGNFVTSIKGYKVDIHCQDLEDFVCDQTDMHDSTNWEDIEKKIKFEFGGYSNAGQRSDKERDIIETARKAWEMMMGIKVTHYERALEEMEKNAAKGWNWFQDKKVDTEAGWHHYYTWKIFDENGKDQGSNVHNTESVQKSGNWEKLDNNVMDGYYQWVHKDHKDNKLILPGQKKITPIQKIKKVLKWK